MGREGGEERGGEEEWGGERREGEGVGRKVEGEGVILTCVYVHVRILNIYSISAKSCVHVGEYCLTKPTFLATCVQVHVCITAKVCSEMMHSYSVNHAH